MQVSQIVNVFYCLDDFFFHENSYLKISSKFSELLNTAVVFVI